MKIFNLIKIIQVKTCHENRKKDESQVPVS